MSAVLPKIFISYRRSDSLSATGRLYDRLNVAFPGMFFRDVSGIGIGVDFTKEIDRAVSSSTALIAVIGPTWATDATDGKRRLDDPDDFVRLEVSSALKRNIRIIPVLVGNASMPDDDLLPADLVPLRKWNAIQLVEEYYEEGLERLIDALSSQLGKPRTQGHVDQFETERKLRDLRGQAEAALAVEDWFAGIQSLQAAVSLDPNNADVAARLRWAHDQRKVSSLFAEGQELYEKGEKSQALVRFRQVRMSAGNYRNVTELISQLEGEVASDTRRSRVFHWTAGAVAAVIVAIVGTGALVVWVVRSEFAGVNTTGLNADDGFVDPGPADVDPPAERVIPPAPASRANTDPAPAKSQTVAQNPAAAEQRVRGFGFPARGRWRMTAQANQALSLAIDLDRDGSFAVSIPTGVMDMPLSAGTYTYDDSTGMLQVSGVDNGGRLFNEFMQIFEREDDHFHVRYQGAVWELTSAN